MHISKLPASSINVYIFHKFHLSLRDLDDTEFFLLMNETNDLRNNTPDARTHHHISPVKCEKKSLTLWWKSGINDGEEIHHWQVSIKLNWEWCPSIWPGSDIIFPLSESCGSTRLGVTHIQHWARGVLDFVPGRCWLAHISSHSHQTRRISLIISNCILNPPEAERLL